MKEFYGHYVRILHWCSEQSVTRALEELELTAAQGQIIGYLSHRETPPCPRDIEERFHLSHPTVSGLLSRLEQKGFVELRPDDADRRCKRIRLLPKGQQCDQQIRDAIDAGERQLLEGFSPTEQAQFKDYLKRAINNLGGSPCKRPVKEEPNA